MINLIAKAARGNRRGSAIASYSGVCSGRETWRLFRAAPRLSHQECPATTQKRLLESFVRASSASPDPPLARSGLLRHQRGPHQWRRDREREPCCPPPRPETPGVGYCIVFLFGSFGDDR